MLGAVGRKIRKAYREHQTPHGRQSVKKLMGHGVLNKSKSRRIPIREQLKQAADQLAKEKPRKRERVKEAVREDR